jgi:eukaryotic-like serine/threonine-protein kinase
MASVFNRLGPFEIQHEIGRGGMAVVFLATDTRLGARVALKLVPDGKDREAREVLEAEQWGAELQKQFSQVSPYVPRVYEHGVESGYFYVAMEYLEGENLSDVITRGRLTVERAAATAIELCRFLEDAHRFEATMGDRSLRSLVHGDLKPRNVRITPAGEVKVLDFGIAKALSLSRKVTRNDFGSIAYLSPERLESGEVDRHADYWAIGVLLHEMLRGRPPFEAPDTRRLEQLILARQPAPPLDAAYPISVHAVAAKLLGPDPLTRYDSASQIREDLERLLAGTQTCAEQEGWPARAADQAPTRRTRTPAEVDDEATRRTAPPLPPPIPVAVPPIPGKAAAQTPAPAAARKPRRLRRFVLGFALLFVVLSVHERWVASAADRVAADVPTRELNQLADVWAQYDLLERRSYLGWATDKLKRSLQEQSAALAERVIENYRSPLPSVREAQWQLARDALARALAVAPGDRALKAALRYCDGHIHRINGEARKGRKQAAEARQEFTEAVTAFREAAELRPKWPDPFLGLARTFIYGLDDVERGADALTQAKRRGYPSSPRELVQLGDGYRARGESLARSARAVAGLSQERDYLSRAAEAYREALSLYAQAGDYDGVPRYIGIAQRRLAQVEDRIAELDNPPGKDPSPLALETAVADPSTLKRVPEPH